MSTVSLSANRAPGGPSDTKDIQDEYGRRLRVPLRKLNAAIRDGIISEDVFLLQNDAKPPEDQEPYDFPTQEGKIRQFMTWFQRQLQRGFLNVVSKSANLFIEAAYEQGANDAAARLDVEGPTPDLSIPPHRTALQEIYTRNYSLLQDVVGDMVPAIRSTLTEGLRDGDHSSDIARSLTNTVDKIGKNRSRLIARTEVMNAYTESSLTQYESVDVEGVTVKSEVLTAHDERVCQVCKKIEEMGVFSLDKFREKTVEIAGRVYSIRPPIHPQCRCTLLPVT